MTENESLDKVITDALINAGVTHPPFLESAKDKIKKLAANKKDSDILSLINEWAKTEDIKNHLLATINSGGGAMGSGSNNRYVDKQSPANWDLWAYIPQCEHWQAVALSLDIEPPENSYQIKGWPSEYDRRIKITSAHIECNSLPRSKTDINKVDLTVFSTWAQSLDWSLPDKFPRVVEVKTASTASNELDHEELLSRLFDPVTVAALEKMFPANDKWKGWAERAARNGLAASRVDTAMFNPYKAAMWFSKKRITGFSLERCYRILANNLPAHSMDKKHLLIGDYD